MTKDEKFRKLKEFQKSTKDWKFVYKRVQRSKYIYCYYKPTIYAKYIKLNDRIHHIKPEFDKMFFIHGLKVTIINRKKTGIEVTSCSTVGPALHSNIDELGSLCCGDLIRLYGNPIEVLTRLPKTLEMMNDDSALSHLYFGTNMKRFITEEKRPFWKIGEYV